MGLPPSVNLGSLTPFATWSEYNSRFFQIQQAIAKMQTATLVKIVSCTNDGGLSPFGFVDVIPLVNQVDGAIPPKGTPQSTIHGLPYLRVQGGTSAIIIDPQPGDIGVAVFASRDISNVKSTQAQANPGTPRQYVFADGMYLGGMLNAVPQQYIQFQDNGITILSPKNIILTGATIQAGSSPVAVVSKPFVTWVNNVLLPALAAHSITVAPPPADSLTTTFEAS